jgi:Flp pilus assembly protein TadG
MALVLPLLLALLMGSVELGNYFMNEHVVVKAVRDGSRYASRQNFSNFTACNGSVDDPVLSNTRTVVKQGLASGGSDLIDWTGATIGVTMSCSTSATSTTYGTQNMAGIYNGRSTGAPIVTVEASVPYKPVLASFGFTGIGFTLNASQRSAVMGI